MQRIPRRPNVNDVMVCRDGRSFEPGPSPGGGGGGGTTWYAGSGAPSGGLGVDGDFYLRTSNGAVYEKSAGSWSVVGNIMGPAGAGYAGTSTTSLATVDTGSQAFTTQTDLAYSVGARVRATSVGSGDWMEGVVSDYSGGVLTIDADTCSGSGTNADWNLNLTGEPGAGGGGGSGITARALISFAYNCVNSAYTVINFDLVDFDADGLITTGASWKFTAAEARTYRVSVAVRMDSDSWTAGDVVAMYLCKNGSVVSALHDFHATVTGTYFIHLRGTDLIALGAGDYIDIQILLQASADRVAAGYGYNYISVEAVD